MKNRIVLIWGVSLFAVTLTFAGCGKKDEPAPPPPPAPANRRRQHPRNRRRQHRRNRRRRWRKKRRAPRPSKDELGLIEVFGYPKGEGF